LEWLGEDLLLLSVLPKNGWIAASVQVDHGLMGSELVRLAVAGRISIAADRITVVDRAACGDAELDAALDSMAAARRPVQPQNWVGRPRPGIRKAYLARLEAAGILHAERGTTLGIVPVTRWRVANSARLAEARARLDAIALSAGPVAVDEAAFGGLAHAIGLGALFYRGRDRRQERKRLEEVAAGNWSVRAVSAATSDRAATDPLAGGAPVAADGSAIHAAHRAAVEAATAAAIHASVAAAHHAASHGGGGGHGGGHH
jgi:hypothetical protein